MCFICCLVDDLELNQFGRNEKQSNSKKRTIFCMTITVEGADGSIQGASTLNWNLQNFTNYIHMYMYLCALIDCFLNKYYLKCIYL